MGRVSDIMEIPQSRMTTATSRPPLRDIRDTVNPPRGPINNIPALVQIMAWRRSGDEPLYGPMMVSLLTHICVTRPQCVNA